MRTVGKSVAILTLGAMATLTVWAPVRAQERPGPRIPIAVADFDYADTSGELRNQEAEHQARLRAFASGLRSALDQDARYQTVALACRQPPCTAGRSDGPELVEQARSAGARLLLYGGFQKMSTLIQFAKVQVVDIEANKVLLDRLISFRGDTDEAWEHAQRFVIREIKTAKLVSEQ
jgi:hypothetical protein